MIGDAFDNSSMAYNRAHSPKIDEDADEMNKLRQKVAHYRGTCRKLDITLKDLKTKTTKDINSLKDKIKVEQQRRIKQQEEKIERLTQLMNDIAEKDKVIFNLNK